MGSKGLSRVSVETIAILNDIWTIFRGTKMLTPEEAKFSRVCGISQSKNDVIIYISKYPKSVTFVSVGAPPYHDDPRCCQVYVVRKGTDSIPYDWGDIGGARDRDPRGTSSCRSDSWSTVLLTRLRRICTIVDQVPHLVRPRCANPETR